MELSGTRTQDQVGPRLTATMPKKKTYNFGHPKNKKKQKNKPTPPGEGAKEEKTEDHGEGGTASGPKVAGTLDIGHFSIVLRQSIITNNS